MLSCFTFNRHLFNIPVSVPCMYSLVYCARTFLNFHVKFFWTNSWHPKHLTRNIKTQNLFYIFTKISWTTVWHFFPDRSGTFFSFYNLNALLCTVGVKKMVPHQDLEPYRLRSVCTRVLVSEHYFPTCKGQHIHSPTRVVFWGSAPLIGSNCPWISRMVLDFLATVLALLQLYYWSREKSRY